MALFLMIAGYFGLSCFSLWECGNKATSFSSEDLGMVTGISTTFFAPITTTILVILKKILT